MRRILLSLWSALQLACASAAAAQPLAPADVPEPLRPWVDWVLRGHEEARCPFLHGGADTRSCLWPSRLELALEPGGGSFVQEWRVYRASWAPLPGDARLWPQGVEVGGRPAVVTARGGVPSVWLEPGVHRVAGRFEWDARPPLLPIPPATALLALSVDGRAVAFPERDEAGRLWLERRAEAGGAPSRLELRVQRLVTDEIPLLLATRIELEVAGPAREELLARALPEGFVPLSLDGPLPARLEADGRLRVQLRPGTWSLDLVARHEGPVAQLARPAPGEGPWSDDEVWAFEARPALRGVEIEGPPAVDPQQTNLPPQWRALPAYRMEPGAVMRLVEQRRGDSDPAPDQLALERTLWLDFDGGGYSVSDRISGAVRRSWRLEMEPDVALGRAAVAGQDQLLTRTAPDAPLGVEIREGRLTLEADSRISGGVRDVPAVGWLHDFHRVSGVLHLPPGWRLLHASGADDVSPTWITRWSLLDFFLVLVISLSVARLWGAGWGALALGALALGWTESQAPRGIWIALLAGEGLLRVMPEGRVRAGLRLYRVAALAVLVVLAVPFMVSQLRAALYSALDPPSAEEPAFAARLPLGAAGEAGALGEEDRSALARELELSRAGRVAALRAEEMALPEATLEQPAAAPAAPTLRWEPDPDARVPTGPGIPRWEWQRISLAWRGPVESGQRLALLLVPPWANALLAVLRVALLAALLACVLGWRGRGSGGGGTAAARAAAAALLLPALGAAPTARADLPPPDLLDELRARLLANPECHPQCAASPRLRIEANGGELRLRLEVDVAALTAVPLPADVRGWSPQRVFVDAEPGSGLMRAGEGLLWLALGPGRHQIVMEGALPPRDSLELALPLVPRRITAELDGWRLEGVEEGRLAGDALQLVRIAAEAQTPAARVAAEALPPFVRVTRALRLGLAWEVETRVERLSPPGAPIVLEVPLLAGESVTTPGIRVREAHALVSLGPQAAELRWRSLLDTRSPLVLAAPRTTAWAETWQVDASPLWHVEPSGIPPVHRPDEAEARLREWRPWPGETLALEITRPEAVPGPTLTLDQSELTLSPGQRATDAVLELELRSSQGGRHEITLPEGARLGELVLDGVAQPVRQEGRSVVIPLTPGAHRARLAWRQEDGIRALFRAPVVDLAAPGVNARVAIAPPADRWILFLGGPRLGPAVLFWSLLAVVALVAFGLARIPWTPLRWHHWALLGVGLTQAPIALAALVVGWLLALGWRGRRGAEAGPWRFDATQLLLALWTAAALVALFLAIQKGLLGLPEMQIRGNDSSASLLRWFQDRSGEALPQPWLLSVPLWVYRAAMLAWSLWIARALLRWLAWGWGCFSEGGTWRPLPRYRRGAA